MERSKAKIPLKVLLLATKPVKQFPWDEETDMSVTVSDVPSLLSDLIAFILSIFKRNRN